MVCGCSAGPASKAANPSLTATPPAPVSVNALKDFLLPSAQINEMMDATEMKSPAEHVGLSDDSASMEPRECLPVDGAAQAKVYAGSGFMAVREQTLRDGDNFTHYAQQAVVLFPSAKQANAFFADSAKQWPRCEEYKHLQSGTEWEIGVMTNLDGMLNSIAAQRDAGADGWACARALTAKNNVIIDINTCSTDPGGTAAEIAEKIAAKVPTEDPKY